MYSLILYKYLSMSFNRRQNRIAGPGFHINVRYDDQTMAMAHSNASTPNARLSLGRTHLENFDVKEQELLVCMASSGMYHDGYTHCFSFANGFPDEDVKNAGDNPDDVAEAVLSKVKFVGVATTEYKPSRAYSEQGFVAQVGGVTTLINEGETTIKPGDSVSLGLNLKLGRKTTRDKGIPREKIRFCLVKTQPSKQMVNKALQAVGGDGTVATAEKKRLEDALKSALKAGGKKPTTEQKRVISQAQTALKAISVCKTGIDGLMDFLAKHQQLNERVIGKAASYARPGDRLEVILQPRNPY